MSKPSFPVVATSFRVLKSGSHSQEEEKKDDYLSYEVEPGFTVRLRQNIDPATDPRKLKRIVSNRVAAQKSRLKKIQYVDDLANKSMDLHKQVSVLRSQVEMASEEKQRLENEQRELKESLSFWRQRLISNQGKVEATIAEIERLQKKVDEESDF